MREKPRRLPNLFIGWNSPVLTVFLDFSPEWIVPFPNCPGSHISDNSRRAAGREPPGLLRASPSEQHGRRLYARLAAQTGGADAPGRRVRFGGTQFALAPAGSDGRNRRFLCGTDRRSAVKPVANCSYEDAGRFDLRRNASVILRMPRGRFETRMIVVWPISVRPNSLWPSLSRARHS